MPSSISTDIAKTLAIVVRELAARGFTCYGVVIDSSASEKKAFDAKAAASVQSLTGTCLIRVTCLSHTINRGIQDIMHKSIPGSDLVGRLRTIINVLPKDKCGDDFYGMPTIVKTRWLCIGEVTDHIAQRYPWIYQLTTSITFTARSAEHVEAV
jgi:hypothetical protein